MLFNGIKLEIFEKFNKMVLLSISFFSLNVINKTLVHSVQLGKMFGFDRNPQTVTS